MSMSTQDSVPPLSNFSCNRSAKSSEISFAKFEQKPWLTLVACTVCHAWHCTLLSMLGQQLNHVIYSLRKLS